MTDSEFRVNARVIDFDRKVMHSLEAHPIPRAYDLSEFGI